MDIKDIACGEGARPTRTHQQLAPRQSVCAISGPGLCVYVNREARAAVSILDLASRQRQLPNLAEHLFGVIALQRLDLDQLAERHLFRLPTHVVIHVRLDSGSPAGCFAGGELRVPPAHGWSVKRR